MGKDIDQRHFEEVVYGDSNNRVTDVVNETSTKGMCSLTPESKKAAKHVVNAELKSELKTWVPNRFAGVNELEQSYAKAHEAIEKLDTPCNKPSSGQKSR
jgi:hypothetical protein